MRVSTEPLGDAIRRLGRSTGLQAPLAQTDSQLLERFVARRDEPAFAALMVRHGPMVLCLCRQMLRDAQEAEDAFQAAFLVLVRNARTIRKRPSLGSWLYGVAYKVAARLRGRAERRRTQERSGLDLTDIPAAGEPVAPDLRFVLHEEIRRLPDKYRMPIILCYLDGKTNEEAAQTLRWPVGTVKARLSRARDMLRLRLARRGLGAETAWLSDEPAPSVARNTASAVPLFLLESTVRAAMRLAGQGVVGGLATARAIGLAKAVAAAMQLAKLKATAVVVLAACVVGAGTTSLSYLSPHEAGMASDAAPTAQPTAAAPAAPADEARKDPKSPPAKKADPARTENVCQAGLMRRLKEWAENVFLGSRVGRPPTADWQAHPFPQQPAERKAATPNNDSADPVCMMDS